MRHFIFLTFRSCLLLFRIILSIFVPYFYRELFRKVLYHILLTLRTLPWDTMGHFGRIKFTNHCNIKWRYRSDVSTVEVPLLRIRWPQSIAHLRTIIKTTNVRSVNKEQVEQKNRNVYRDQKAHSYYGNIAHDTLLNCLKNFNKSLAI